MTHGAMAHGLTAGGPALVGWLLAVVCALAGGGCLLRARHAGAAGRWAARSEALMGFGMAAMALPGAMAGVPPELFALLFGAAACWELALLVSRAPRRARGAGGGRRTAHHVHHMVGALAMVHMAVAMAAGRDGAAGTEPHTGALTGAYAGALTTVLLGYYAAYLVWAGLRLLPRASAAALPATGGTGGRPGGLAAGAGGCAPPAAAATARPGTGTLGLPGLATACRLAMGTGMVAMLLTL